MAPQELVGTVQLLSHVLLLNTGIIVTCGRPQGLRVGSTDLGKIPVDGTYVLLVFAQGTNWDDSDSDSDLVGITLLKNLQFLQQTMRLSQKRVDTLLTPHCLNC